MSEYTKGPWQIRRLTNGHPVIAADNGDIADLRYNLNNKDKIEANARLIAAAPKLLEASKALLAWRPITDDAIEFYRAQKSLEAAIAEAEKGE